MIKKILLLMCVIGLVACAGQQVTNKAVMTEEVVISATTVAAAPQPQIAIPAAAKIVRISDVVMFDFDSSVIREDQMPVIESVAKLMNEFPQTVLALNGFASKEGPAEYNVVLSQARADAVKDALIDKGVSADRIAGVTGLGATIDFGDLLKENRRVMILSIN